MSEEVRRAAQDLKRCEAFLSQSRIRSEIAIHYSTVAANNFDSAPLLKGFSYRNTLRDNFRRALGHRNVDLIDTPHSPDGYRVIFSPFLTTLDRDLLDRMTAWVTAGGTWIAGPMVDIFTADTVRPTIAPMFSLESLCGARIRYQSPLDDPTVTAAWADGSPCGVSLTYDALEPVDCEVLATYASGEFAGMAAITRRQIGAGQLILLGSLPDAEGVRRLCGLPSILAASENLCVTAREGAICGITVAELENRTGEVTLPRPYRDLLTNRILNGTVTVAPYEVLVLAEK